MILLPMLIDLERLHEMHPRLPLDLALLLAARAALGLERNDHQSGTVMSLRVGRKAIDGLLSWTPVESKSVMEQHDNHRITEDGAEAITLAFAHRHHGWRVVRRLQREEHADWLLEQVNEAGRQLVALEVSGVNKGSIAMRLRQKLAQVAECSDIDQRWAGIVGFEAPTAVLRST